MDKAPLKIQDMKTGMTLKSPWGTFARVLSGYDDSKLVVISPDECNGDAYDVIDFDCLFAGWEVYHVAS